MDNGIATTTQFEFIALRFWTIVCNLFVQQRISFDFGIILTLILKQWNGIVQHPEADTLPKTITNKHHQKPSTSPALPLIVSQLPEVIAEVAEMDSFNWGYDPVAKLIDR